MGVPFFPLKTGPLLTEEGAKLHKGPYDPVAALPKSYV